VGGLCPSGRFIGKQYQENTENAENKSVITTRAIQLALKQIV
jgi:hypothetical protein